MTLGLSLVSQKFKKLQDFVRIVARRACFRSDSQLAHNSYRFYPLWRHPFPLLFLALKTGMRLMLLILA